MALLLLVTWQYLASTVFPAGELFGIPACQFLFVSSFFNGWEHSRRSSICFFVISGQQLTRTNKQQTTISTLTGIFTSLFLSSAEQPLKNFITLQIFRWIFLLPPFSHRDWRGVCFSVFVLRNTNHKKAKSRRREKKKKNPKPKRGSERKQLVAIWSIWLRSQSRSRNRLGVYLCTKSRSKRARKIQSNGTVNNGKDAGGDLSDIWFLDSNFVIADCSNLESTDCHTSTLWKEATF